MDGEKKKQEHDGSAVRRSAACRSAAKPSFSVQKRSRVPSIPRERSLVSQSTGYSLSCKTRSILVLHSRTGILNNTRILLSLPFSLTVTSFVEYYSKLIISYPFCHLRKDDTDILSALDQSPMASSDVSIWRDSESTIVGLLLDVNAEDQYSSS